jgi:hypothetical protein
MPGDGKATEGMVSAVGSAGSTALGLIERALANAGSGKVMLRPDEAAAIRAALARISPPGCSLQDQGLPCVCGGRADCPERAGRANRTVRLFIPR